MSQLVTALLTIEQAKSVWCPEARTTSTDSDEGVAPATVNRRAWGEADVGATCLGDGCMFWRWHDLGERHQAHLAQVKAQVVPSYGLISGGVTATWEGEPDDGRDWQLNEEEGEWYVPAPSLPPRGYCGKAGHPHQAALLEAQIELLHHQLHEHRRACGPSLPRVLPSIHGAVPAGAALRRDSPHPGSPP